MKIDNANLKPSGNVMADPWAGFGRGEEERESKRVRVGEDVGDRAKNEVDTGEDETDLVDSICGA